MSVTADQIAQLRRMIAEQTTATYSDAVLTAYVERYSVPDSRGVMPWTLDTSTEPPAYESNTAWMPTYDLNAVAAEVWEEKASAVACDYATNSDGVNVQRNQVYEQYMKTAQRYRSRRCLTSASFVRPERVRDEHGYIRETTAIIDRVDGDEVFNQ